MNTQFIFPPLLALFIGWQPFNVLAQNSSNKVDERFDCPVTIGAGARTEYGNDALTTALWPDGKVVFRAGGPGKINQDGSLGMKWSWVRKKNGHLTIKGRRLDADAPPLRSIVMEGYGDSGFQSGALIFPTPGCWEVTSMLGDSSLTFVTLVVHLGTQTR